jgi:hypothetical protein
VVWPAGTTLTTDPPELHVPGGLTARPGDTIEGGGGWIPGTDRHIEGDLDKAIACAADGGREIAFFTALDDGVSITADG